MNLRSAWVFACTVVWLGCSASPQIDLGNERDAATAGSGGTGAGGAGVGGFGGFGGAGNALTAAITEPPSPIAIEIVTLDCGGECKQVRAIASGGNAPYGFAWSDGIREATRMICAEDGSALSVSVTDTAIAGDEFQYEGQTANVSVAITQLTCPDGGVSDAGLADTGVADASTNDAGHVDACGGSSVTQTGGTCHARPSHVCPGSTNVAVDLARPIEPGEARCIEMHARPPGLIQTDAYLSLGRDCMPLEGQGFWRNSIPGGYVFGICFAAMNERITQIIITPGLGYFEDAYQIAECDSCSPPR